MGLQEDISAITFRISKERRHQTSLASGRKGLLRDKKEKERSGLSLRPRADAELSWCPEGAEAGELWPASVSSGNPQDHTRQAAL